MTSGLKNLNLLLHSYLGATFHVLFKDLYPPLNKYNYRNTIFYFRAC